MILQNWLIQHKEILRKLGISLIACPLFLWMLYIICLFLSILPIKAAITLVCIAMGFAAIGISEVANDMAKYR